MQELTTGAPSIAARLEGLAMTPAMWRRIGLLSLGGFFEFYDMFLSAYAAPGLVRAHLLATTTTSFFGMTGIASFVAALFAGLFVGTALFGFLADRFGRRLVFTTSLLWYSAATTIMAFQRDPYTLDLWRFIAGVGIGVELVTIDAYIAELVPSEMRGRAFAFNQAIQLSAIPVVALFAYLLVPYAPLGIDGWRWLVLIGAAGAITIWWIRRGVPESPRWLALHGKTAEAEAILSSFERDAGVARPVTGAGSVGGDETGRFSEIWREPYLMRTVMLIVFNVFQTVGFYGFSNWVPTLLTHQGISVTSSLGYTFVIAIAAPIGPILGFFLTDRVERKWLIAGSALGVALFGLVFAQMRGGALIILFGAAVTLANNIMSFSFHAYQAELYPTRVRGAATGFVYSFSRLSTVFTAFLIAFVLGRFGTGGVFALIAAAMLIVFIVIAALGPRTTNRSLETISA